MLGRWPTSLTLRARTHGPTGAALNRANRFPPFADLSSYVPAEVLPARPTGGAGGTADAAGGDAVAAEGPGAGSAPPALGDTHQLVLQMSMSMFQVRSCTEGARGRTHVIARPCTALGSLVDSAWRTHGLSPCRMLRHTHRLRHAGGMTRDTTSH